MKINEIIELQAKLQKELDDLEKEMSIKLKKCRKSLGLSQLKLAEEIGVSESYIRKVEKGLRKVNEQMINFMLREGE